MTLRWAAPLVLFACSYSRPRAGRRAAFNGEPGARQSASAELEGRSFRQFEPGKGRSPRKAVVIDFFGPSGIYAQYAEGGHVVHEWELSAEDYSIEQRGGGAEITLRFIEPRTRQQFPTQCSDCVPVSGFSISIRDVFDTEEIEFRLNDPEGVLPSPFPVFTSWTRFREDEIQN